MHAARLQQRTRKSSGSLCLWVPALKAKLRGAKGFVLGKIRFNKCGAPTCWPKAERLYLVLTRGPETAIPIRQSSCADSGKGWAAKEKNLATVTKGGFKQQSTPSFSMCTKSFIYFSSCAHSRNKLARTTRGS